MSKNYLVSIIIVTFNAEKHIEGVLDSLSNRFNEKIEVIIVDGLSTDTTLNIVKKYGKFISKVISEKDSGIYDAMNKGVAHSNGRFILFLGSDDKLAINLEELALYLIDDKTVYYGDVRLTPSDKIYGGKYNTFKLLNRNICQQCILYPRAVFKEFQFGSSYKYLEDYIMNMKLWRSKSFTFLYINKTIAIYNTTGLSSTYRDTAFKKDSWKFIYKNFGFLGIVIKCINPIRNFFFCNLKSLVSDKTF